MPTTNITEDHRRAFEALTSGRFHNFCLVSCFVDGEPTAPIAAVNVTPPAEDGGEPEYLISPLPELTGIPVEPATTTLNLSDQPRPEEGTAP